MNYAKNSLGEIYGNLTIQSVISPSDRLGYKVKCRCSCGLTGIFRFSKLVNGHTKSCGCLVTSKSKSKRLPNGHVIGTRTIIDNSLWKHTGKDNTRVAAAKTVCSCGHVAVVMMQCLKNGQGCKYCSKKGRPSPQKLKFMDKGRQLAHVCQIDRTSKNIQRLLSHAVSRSRPIHQNKNFFIRSFTRREINLLCPLGLNVPCIWPWDNEGYPLTDIAVKKARKDAHCR